MRALLSSLFAASPRRQEGERLLDAITVQARRPVFYEAFAAPDTLDGRFDLMALHAWMVFEGLRARGKAASGLAQTTADLMFGAFDDAIRSLGVGDSGVPRRIKAMGKAYYGRSKSYSEASDRAQMAEALARNIYRGRAPAPGLLDGLADYVLAEVRRLRQHPLERFQAGDLDFAAPGVPQTA